MRRGAMVGLAALARFEDGNDYYMDFGPDVTWKVTLERLLPPGHEQSDPEEFLDNMLSFVVPTMDCAFTPEKPEPGPK